MTINEKYNFLRSHISNGDLILIKGTGFVACIIRWFDKSYYSHIGVIVEKHGALFIVDANGKGVQADRLSWRINSYKDKADFCILKPLNDLEIINMEMKIILKRSDDKWIKYDFKNGLKEMFNRRFKTKFNITLNEDADICSDFVSRYAISLGMVNSDFRKLIIAFPQDYMRYIDRMNTEIIT